MAIKDLQNLGRDLRRTIIVDNLAENFDQTTPANGIWVESWYDDLDDTVLTKLLPFLETLVIEEVEDVRAYLGPKQRKAIENCWSGSGPIPSLESLLEL